MIIMIIIAIQVKIIRREIIVIVIRREIIVILRTRRTIIPMRSEPPTPTRAPDSPFR